MQGEETDFESLLEQKEEEEDVNIGRYFCLRSVRLGGCTVCSNAVFVHQGKLKYSRGGGCKAKEGTLHTSFSNDSSCAEEKQTYMYVKRLHLISVRKRRTKQSNLQHLAGSHIPFGGLLGTFHLL